MSTPVSQEEKQAALARLNRFSQMADNAIGIPFTRFRIGLEPIIGLVPVLGDLAGLLMSCYVLLEAHRAGASPRVKQQMVRNMLIDFFGGLVPVIGDVFDFAWKANVRNTQLLREHLETELNVQQKPRFHWMQFLVIVGTLAVFTALVAVFAL
ncbi:DUF4112 domain-containing protein [Marinobacter sp. UBA2688]|uniref:DUF4112 domain-containing protein n=1 Tax=Marinobacter sp. UBA2688 TaxID=1946816 RepID=UPI002579FDC1|nr:DUF4112 domain-containing protein [Marinobacter sp. UBA2688]|tara:strand:- start:2891 stop:3349 length:459 start_codon:yes stop_codon:yes gene_type:complete